MRMYLPAGLLCLLLCCVSAWAQEPETPKAVALREVRAAMAARDLPAIKAKLEAASKLKGDPAYDTEFNRLELLATYVTQFWQAVDRAGKTMQAEAGIRELKIGDQVAAFVEYENRTLVIRIAGVNRTYPLSALPPKIALVMAEQQLDPQNANNKVFFGAFAAMDGRGDRKVARQYWDEAARVKVDVKFLLPELDVPRAAPAVVIPALSPLVKNLLQPKNWSLRVKGASGWVKKPLGDAGQQNEQGWLVVQAPEGSGEVQLVFSRPLTPNFVCRVYLDGITEGQQIGVVSNAGDDDALLTELPTGTVMIEFGRQAGQLKARLGEEEIELTPTGKANPRMQGLFGIVAPAGAKVTVASFEIGVP